MSVTALDSNLSQINPIHFIWYTIHFNIIVPSKSTSHKRSHLFTFSKLSVFLSTPKHKNNSFCNSLQPPAPSPPPQPLFFT